MVQHCPTVVPQAHQLLIVRCALWVQAPAYFAARQLTSECCPSRAKQGLPLLLVGHRTQLGRPHKH